MLHLGFLKTSKWCLKLRYHAFVLVKQEINIMYRFNVSKIVKNELIIIS